MLVFGQIRLDCSFKSHDKNTKGEGLIKARKQKNFREYSGMNFWEWVDFLCIIPQFWKLLKRHPHLRVNAHNHTKESDGVMGLVSLLFWNWICGFWEVWITDHNIVWDEKNLWNRFIAWFFEFFLNVKTVAGVEISCNADLSRYCGCEYEEVHLVGGEFKRDTQFLKERLELSQAGRDKRTEATVEEIEKKGFNIPSYAEMKKKYGNITARVIAENVFDEKGRRIDPETFEKNYLQRGQEFYLPKDFLPTVKEALSLIERAGGWRIFPHPWKTLGSEGFNLSRSDVLLLFKSQGLQKVESNTKRQTKEMKDNIERDCFVCGLQISGGGDVHDMGDFRDYMKNMFKVYA